MSACERCGTDGGFLYTCPDCGGHYCDEHQAVAAHDCVLERGFVIDPDPWPSSEGIDTPEGKPEEEPTAAPSDESGGEAPATATEDDDSGETDVATTDQAPTANGEVRFEGTDDHAEQTEVEGVLRRSPGLGRFFG